MSVATSDMDETLREIWRGRSILIAGPTASGKSALALALAEKKDGVIINVDSMQVYCVLNLLTARPQGPELARAPHRLYGHAHPSRPYSVGIWTEEVSALLTEIGDRTPIFVGGTGLYFRALLGGLSHMPPVPASVRQRLRREMMERGTQAMHDRLHMVDPLAAEGIRPMDGQRILRALEVLEASGEPISRWQARKGMPLIDPSRAEAYVIEPDRKELAGRIEERLRQMVRGGVMEEVRALLSLRLDETVPAMKAIGVREFAEADAGRVSLETAIAQAAAATRRYAKRQMTWFRHQFGPEWRRVPMREAGFSILLDGGKEAP